MIDRPDGTALAALALDNRPRFFAYLDVIGDPLRATTWPHDLAFSGTGDVDLDGFTFAAVDPQFVSISAVKTADGGGDTVLASLSGLIGPDSTLLNLLGTPANWRGRSARLWQGVANVDGAAQGAVWSYFTGTMSSMKISGSGTAQTVEVSIETYLAILAPPSNRTYQDQALFDPADRSSEVLIPIANGVSGAGIDAATNGGFGGGGGGRSFGDFGGIRVL